MNDEQNRLIEVKKDIQTLFQNRYRVVALLGRGGMGEVYLAVTNDQAAIQRAIKIIHKGNHSKLNAYDEVEALTQIKNPGVPRIVEIEQNDKAFFIVQEYVKGKSFQKIVKESGRVSEDTVLLWMQDVAKIIEAVHNEGFLHLDIKPDNIIIQGDGKAKLIDFGVAQKLEKRSDGAGGIFGSRYYTAPERLRGEPNDYRTDVFGYGATFYFLVTGERPPAIKPNDEAPITIMKRKLASVQSPVIRFILQNCISFNPDRRYQNFRDIHSALLQKDLYNQAVLNEEKKRKTRLYGIMAMFAAGIILIAGGGLCLNTARNNRYDALINQGETYMTSSNLKKAKKCYQHAIKLKKGEPAGYQGLYETYTAKKEYNKVIQGILELFGNEPSMSDSAELRYLLGNAYYENGDYDQAEYNLKKAVALKPSLEEHLVLGLTYCAEGRYEKAQQVIQDLRKDGKNTDGADYLSGQISEKQNDESDAISDYKQVIDETKNHALKQRAILSLAGLYRHRKSFYDEINVLETAQSEDAFANNIPIREQLGEAYYYAAENGGRSYYKKAIDQYQKLIDSGFSSAQTYRNLAICYQKYGNYAQADATLDQMIQAYPDDYTGYMQRCYLILEEEENKDQDQRDYSAFETNYRAMMNRAGDAASDDSEIAVLESRYEELQEKGWL
ncbi:serine/threonine-protein kinase [uncultured Pseudoramibacter sp.]|uniref:serine/threonine-protein kinase n=1 Tax=uncultured Pseudoramibacter sp. TaxID=1623493 RepID=UPI0025E560BF|nr:serine/threonine-protein kinase [uncultured Pseudoramibacter sp.]